MGTVSLYDQTLHKLKGRIRTAYQAELKAKTGVQRAWYRSLRWCLMIQHEFSRDEIGIRAESLSYFTLFSTLPLVAGGFILMGFLGQWAPVQVGFTNLIARFLQPIPEDYRADLTAFVIQFKNEYLKHIAEQSSSIGIFALLVLVWIGGKVFFNIEYLMNRIWNTDLHRPMFERIQNFVFCGVIAPVVATIAITLPGLLGSFGGLQVGLWLDQGLPSGLMFMGLLFVFRFLPNIKVKWKSALYGALVSTVLFTISSLALKIYFRFGTNTAYGKLAVLPIFAIFVYMFWVILILGAEISYLVQNPDTFTGEELPPGTFAEAVLLVEVFRHLKSRFHLGKPAISVNDLSREFKVGADSMMVVLTFLLRKRVILEVTSPSQKDVTQFSLARELHEDDLISLIKEFLDVARLSQSFDVQSVIHALHSK
jgi:membrane protein